MGIMLAPRPHLSQLAPGGHARLGARLRDDPRAHAPPADESFAEVLEARRRRLPRLPERPPLAAGARPGAIKGYASKSTATIVSLRSRPSLATGSCRGCFAYTSSAVRSRNDTTSPASYDRGERTKSGPTFKSRIPSMSFNPDNRDW